MATPALTRSVAGAGIVYLGVQLRRGAADVAAVERRWNSTQHFFTDFEVTGQLQAQADQAIRPEALALGVFGGIAALAVLLLADPVRGAAAERPRARSGSHAGRWRRPCNDGSRRPPRHPRIGPGRFRPCGRRGGGSLDPLPHRAGACRLPRPGCGRGLDRARRRVRRPGHRHRGGRRAAGVPRGAASRPAACPLPGRPLDHGASRHPVRACRPRPWRAPPFRCRPAERTVVWSLPLGRSLGRHRHDRGDDDIDLRLEPAHAGVPARSVRMELGLRGAELRRVRARPEQGGGGPAPRPRGHVVLGRLVRHHAARRGRGPDAAVQPRRPGRPADRLGSGLATSHEIVLGAATLAQLHKQIGDTVEMQLRARLPAPAHPAHDRRGGHHAGHRDRRGAPHVHGGRRRGAGRRRPGDREPWTAGLRPVVQRTQHGLAPGPGRPGLAAGAGRGAAALRRRQQDAGPAST